MMRINKLTDYGIVIAVRIASGERGRLHTAREIAAATRVPQPTVTRLLKQLARSGIPIVGLDYKDEDAKARDYLAEYGNPFREVIVDADGQLGLDLGVYGAPETFLINPRGEIVLRHVGEMNQRVWDDKFAPVLQQAGEASGVAP